LVELRKAKGMMEEQSKGGRNDTHEKGISFTALYPVSDNENFQTRSISRKKHPVDSLNLTVSRSPYIKSDSTGRTWVEFNVRGSQNPTKVSDTTSAHWVGSYCWQWQATWQQKGNSLLLFYINALDIYIADSDIYYAIMHRPNNYCISIRTCLVTAAFSFFLFRATISSGYLNGPNP